MLKWIKRIALLVLVLVIVAFGTGWWLLRGSVPKLDGELALPGLSASASIQRDAQGVWHGENTEAVLKPEAVQQRLAELEGEWATVGTGWAAWP